MGDAEAAEKPRGKYSEGIPSPREVRERFHARCGANKQCLAYADEMERNWNIMRAHGVVLDTSPNPDKEMIGNGKYKLIDVFEANKLKMKENEEKFEQYLKEFREI